MFFDNRINSVKTKTPSRKRSNWHLRYNVLNPSVAPHAGARIETGL